MNKLLTIVGLATLAASREHPVLKDSRIRNQDVNQVIDQLDQMDRAAEWRRRKYQKRSEKRAKDFNLWAKEAGLTKSKARKQKLQDFTNEDFIYLVSDFA
jgi:hypothetical protein